MAASKILVGVSLAVSPWTSAGNSAPYAYGPFSVKPALHYFRHWSEVAISQLLEEQGGFADDKFVQAPPTSAEQVGFLVRQHEATVCAAAWPVTIAIDMHSSIMDERGVHHAVLKTESERLQYVATKHGRVLFMDPPACALHSMAVQAQEAALAKRRLGFDAFADGKNNALEDPPELGHKDSIEGDKEELLHPHHDELVKDCVEVFQRTAEDHCKESLKVEVLSASLMVVDGIEVRLHAKISHRKGEPTMHRIRCAFEPTSKTDAMKGVDDPKEASQEEKDGLHVTVLMHLDICEAAEKDSVSDSTKKTLRLFEMHGTGELSLLKGYRHVYDQLPEWVSELQVKAEELPTDHDLRQVEPLCFPGDDGEEVVRNQGTCGSCWAFAAASTLMANLCVKGDGRYSLETRADRYEVSVQRILSCNKYNYGCEGGHALAAADSFQRALMATDEAVPYMCGGGDALKHFEVQSTTCDEAPWGGSKESCDAAKAKSEWQFHKLFSVSGEVPMQQAMVEGRSLMCGMKVYENFFHPKSDVYSATEGNVLGAHAVTLVGYGVLGSEKYWVLQNSWGPDWNDHGYVKFGRGRNLAEIESKGIYFDAEPVAGGTLPPEVQETPIQRLMNWARKCARNKPKAVLIGGAVGAGVLLLGFFGLGAYCVCCRKKKGDYQKAPDSAPEPQNTA